MSEGKVIILSNLEQIYSSFYDLFNQNYLNKDGIKYCHGTGINELVNENTKIYNISR